MPTNLAPVYLDDARVLLHGDARPKVAAIVAASGRPAPSEMHVVRVNAPGETQGDALSFEDVIERAEQGPPVYLRLVARGEETETQAEFGKDESRGVGTTESFGAARTGIAGQGAKTSTTPLPADKQAKSDVNTNEGNAMRDQSTDNAGRPQAHRGERPQRSREGARPEAASDAD